MNAPAEPAIKGAVQNVLSHAKRYAAPPTGFARFSLTERTDEMREKMRDQVEVLPRLALAGQWTVFYAAPNTGKTLLTLWMLREAIRSGAIDGSRVLYINCDDTFRGLVDKAEFARASGFGMAADGEEGFKASALLPEMRRAVQDGDAAGTVLVLDTLKKFVGLMDKSKQTEANKIIRAFVMAGGTVITLAHVNKHRGDDGALVYQGTTDQLDDADCGYTMDVVARHESRVVTFTNLKMRGDVATSYGLEYLARGSWRDRVESVRVIGEHEIAEAKKADRVAEILDRNAKLIAAVRDVLKDGPMKKTELVAAVREETGESKKRVLDVLGKHEGKRWSDGHRWIAAQGERNFIEYTTLPEPLQ